MKDEKIKIQVVTEKPADVLVCFQKTRKRNRMIKNWESMMDIASITEGRIIVEKVFQLKRGVQTMFLKVVGKNGVIKIPYSELVIWSNGKEIHNRKNPFLNKQRIRFIV